MKMCKLAIIGPPLSKKSFPVSRVGEKKASREVGNLFFFFPNFIFYILECTGGKTKKKNLLKIRKTKVPVGP